MSDVILAGIIGAVAGLGGGLGGAGILAWATAKAASDQRTADADNVGKQLAQNADAVADQLRHDREMRDQEQLRTFLRDNWRPCA